ncbi:MAG: hypothetical protein AAGB00_01890, partial [Planctomycetota bacterium]
MSYKSFKSFVGETNLERKCRWWFGISLVLLLGLSFYGANLRMGGVVTLTDRKLGPELVRAWWLEAHSNIEWQLEQRDAQLAGEVLDPGVDESAAFYRDLLESNRSLGSRFEPYVILPQDPEINPNRLGAPGDAFEAERVARLPPRVAVGEEAGPSASAPQDPFDFRLPDMPEGHFDRVLDGQQKYQYYQPLYADSSCVFCHRSLGTVKMPQLVEGDLMAVVRVETDHRQTDDLKAQT